MGTAPVLACVVRGGTIGSELAWSNMFSQHAYGASVGATRYGQRLTFHPSHFVKLATADEALLRKSLKELEVHSQVRACPRTHGLELLSVERLDVGGLHMALETD